MKLSKGYCDVYNISIYIAHTFQLLLSKYEKDKHRRYTFILTMSNTIAVHSNYHVHQKTNKKTKPSVNINFKNQMTYK